MCLTIKNFIIKDEILTFGYGLSMTNGSFEDHTSSMASCSFGLLSAVQCVYCWLKECVC